MQIFDSPWTLDASCFICQDNEQKKFDIKFITFFVNREFLGSAEVNYYAEYKVRIGGGPKYFDMCPCKTPPRENDKKTGSITTVSLKYIDI